MCLRKSIKQCCKLEKYLQIDTSNDLLHLYMKFDIPVFSDFICFSKIILYFMSNPRAVKTNLEFLNGVPWNLFIHTQHLHGYLYLLFHQWIDSIIQYRNLSDVDFHTCFSCRSMACDYNCNKWTAVIKNSYLSSRKRHHPFTFEKIRKKNGRDQRKIW